MSDEATVERVARAIVIANKRDPDQTIYKRNGPDDFEPVGCEWQRHEHEARAAIAAIAALQPQGDGLAELRALSDVSSQGEWVLNTFNFKPEIKAGGNVIGFLRTHPDAAFIVACVNYVRRVLAGDAP